MLASASPRRKELLSLLFKDFEIISANADETTMKTSPEDIVMDLALKKARAASPFAKNSELIISADTLVFCNGKQLGKPRDANDASVMLKELSKKTHSVFTGFCLMRDEEFILDYERTKVTFNSLTQDEIEAYIGTGEPMDKAGAYGIQGYASRFISKIDGCYFNVVGLPISKLYQDIKKFYPSALM